MYRDRSPPPPSRLDSLLKQQAERLDPALDSWKTFRSEVRAAEPTRKIEELKALNRQTTPLRSPNHSFSRDSLFTSPLRERLAGQHVATQSTDRRYQSPISKAKDKFEAFYESLKSQGRGSEQNRAVLGRIQTLVKGPLPPRSPTNLEVKLQGLSAAKRLGSPRGRGEEMGKDVRELPSILPLQRLQQAKEALQRTGLQGLTPSYESELRAFAKLVIASYGAREQPS